MKKLFFLLLFIPIIGNAQTSEVCDCANILLSMAKEAKYAKMDMEKMKAIQEKYKARMAKCDELGDSKTEEEKKKMVEEIKKCPSYKELEEIQKELMGESEEEIETKIKTEEEIKKEKMEIARDLYNNGITLSWHDETEDKKKAIEYFSQALEYHPKCPEAYCYRAIAKIDIEDYTGAMNDFKIALDLLNDINYNKSEIYFFVVKKRLDYEIYYSRGLLKNILGDYRGAIIDLTKAISLDTDYDEVYFELGNSKYGLKDYKGAIVEYNIAIKKFDGNAEAYYNRGLSKLYLADKEGACLDFSKAGELGLADAYKLIRENCN